MHAYTAYVLTLQISAYFARMHSQIPRVYFHNIDVQVKTMQDFYLASMANQQQGSNQELEEETVAARLLARRQRTEARHLRERECHWQRRLAGTQCFFKKFIWEDEVRCIWCETGRNCCGKKQEGRSATDYLLIIILILISNYSTCTVAKHFCM